MTPEKRDDYILIVTAILFMAVMGYILMETRSPRNDGTAPASQQVCYEVPASDQVVRLDRQSSKLIITFKHVNTPFNYNGDAVLGLTRWSVIGDTAFCNIYADLPEQVYGDQRMEVLGHEFLHCLTGSFHE